MSKSIQADDIIIQQLPEGQPLPMELLLMADPNEEQIRTYIEYCIVVIAIHNQKVIGVMAMSPETKEKAEIRNIAIAPAHRGKGFARRLLQDAFDRATRLGYSLVQVCTGNSSIRQFKVYQQFGFELTDVRWNYFTDHFPEPIIEDGILCRHQLVLSRVLQDKSQ
ncbi:GNAT family N-acetyltransferase [Flavihumibacter fluvii]|uniref:GNAT family N-acetyltransferase n=1 Tax=Flavihumibacter fluvii TaxID=2838157 RepID=UPI001BDE5E48|nr:GNAT family N-acetyltransferase [Flavihumibacter fluvii]ULQ53131.1 GNAT family N-acetyltransferase [Flavihumibacter fluvii]